MIEKPAGERKLRSLISDPQAAEEAYLRAYRYLSDQSPCGHSQRCVAAAARSCRALYSRHMRKRKKALTLFLPVRDDFDPLGRAVLEKNVSNVEEAIHCLMV